MQTILDQKATQLKNTVSNEFLPEIITNELNLEIDYETKDVYPNIFLIHNVSTAVVLYITIKENKIVIDPTKDYINSNKIYTPFNRSHSYIGKLARLYRKEN